MQKNNQTSAHAHHVHSHSHCSCHAEACSCDDRSRLPSWLLPSLSAILLVMGISFSAFDLSWFRLPWFESLWYFVAFLPVGLPVMRGAFDSVLRHREVFNEFMLMSLAAIGAFSIGEYPEAVAVMLLYVIGETLQEKAVDRARDQIKSLVALRPDSARLVCESGGSVGYEEVDPSVVSVGEVIEVRPGERVPLDGELLSSPASFNTAALTGESLPRVVETGCEILSGFIVADAVVRIKVLRGESESAVSRILKMVEGASGRKSSTELFIHRFARYYTPLVILLSVLVLVMPWIYSLLGTYVFDFPLWLHRSLVFLIISCPCALVISVPLSYFAGIGAASRIGILFKGGNFLDAMSALDAVVFDKTGTLTTGDFEVMGMVGLSEHDLLEVASIEQKISHPLAAAIVEYAGADNLLEFEGEIRNVSGYGVEANGWLIGAPRLLEMHHIAYPDDVCSGSHTPVLCAYGNQYKGAVLLADRPKADAAEAVSMLRREGVVHLQMLSGDKQALVSQVGRQLGLDAAFGDLLPQDKVRHIEELRSRGLRTAFVGDGINDAPVLALSDVGIAMGGMGADMAIETADVIIQTDQPSKVGDAVGIARRTRCIAIQNIVFAIGVKLLVMLLGVLGVATLWEAVFADTGVTIIAVLNSLRLFRNVGRK